MSKFELYPEILPFRSRMLAVDDLHTLHVEESGRSGGLPVVFLHGGPGAGCEPWHRRFFDPERYHIVLFDQRGSGRSVPHASLERNTTQALIEDIEQVRQALNIDRWVVFGGSWGSTLGLAYAQTHPERVLGLVLRGIFLCRPQDIAWFYQEGANRLFPDYWEDFIALVPEAERDDVLAAYHRRLTGDDEIARMAAARAWARWEGRTASLLPNRSVEEHFIDPHVALSLARIENHYFINKAFLQPEQLLRNASRLSGIPGYIIHGRYDVICSLDQAWALHRVWPEAHFEVIGDAGHSASEPGIVEALIRATRELADRYA